MESNIDLKARKFRDYLISYIDSVNELPPEVKRLILSEVLWKLEAESDEIIRRQQQALAQDDRKEMIENAESTRKSELGELPK